MDFAAARSRLVADLKRWGYIKTPAVERALITVPREEFIPEHRRNEAYDDMPLPIPYGQTISAPSMIAIMLEESALSKGLKVLEIGAGSGYNAALVAEIVGPEKVISIERYDELAEWGRQNLQRCGYEVKVIVGDGSLGYAPESPYDRIIATAGAPRLPKSWIDQAVVGGMIIAPIGRSRFSQTLEIVTKVAEGNMEVRHGVPCAFVPLVGKEGWSSS